MTLDEIQKEIMWDIRKRQLLQRTNGGKNLLNFGNKEKKPYRIGVFLKVEMDLAQIRAELFIKTNLPINNYSGNSLNDLESFVSQFKKWTATPRYYSKDFNRKEKVSRYQLGNLRQPLIRHEDIEIMVYPEAQKFLERKGVPNFANMVKELCLLQREATKEEKKAIDKYVILTETTQLLDKFQPPKYSYYNNYNDNNSQKLKMSQKEQKQKIQAIKQDLKSLAQKYKFLPMPTPRE